MKNFIITISIIGVLAILVTFQGDMNKLIRESNDLQQISNKMSIAISNKIDLPKYGDGDICFLSTEAKSMVSMLGENINNRYWTEGSEILVTMISENDYKTSTVIKMTNDGTITEHTKQQTNENITTPTVETIIVGHSPDFALSFLRNLKLKVNKKAVAEYQGH